MKKDLLKTIMHPIRIKIIQELSMKQKATTKELQESCGDYAQATIYRHLKSLLDHEIIKVVSSHQVNGIIEKVYGIADDFNKKIIGDPEKLTKDDYLNLFTQFIMSLLTDFTAYFEEEDAIQHVKESIGFSTRTLLLSDDELIEMSKEISQIISKRISHKPSEKRKMRKYSTILTTTLKNK